MINDQDNLTKKAPKRFAYPVTAHIELNNAREAIQIQNISKTGIQFYSNIAIPTQSQIRMTWQDAKIGEMESFLLVVRAIEHQEPSFEYCYGSKFVNLKDDVRRNLNRVVETTEELERKIFEKSLDNVPFKTINDVITHGRLFLRDTLRGNKSSSVIDQFAQELKDYEKESFGNGDEASQWLQKLVTQHFHAKVLLVVLSSSVKLNDLKKLITDKIHTMECLANECQKWLESKTIPRTLKAMGKLQESLKRI